MNGLLNNNTIFGIVLSQRLPPDEKLMVALSAGLSRGPMAPLLLSPLINERINQEEKRIAAEKKVETLASAIEIEVPLVTSEVRLKVLAAEAAKFVKNSGTGNAVLSDNGVVTFNGEDEGELTLAIAVAGVERPVVVRRRDPPRPGVARGGATHVVAREATEMVEEAELEPRGEQAEPAGDQSSRRRSR